MLSNVKRSKRDVFYGEINLFLTGLRFCFNKRVKRAQLERVSVIYDVIFHTMRKYAYFQDFFVLSPFSLQLNLEAFSFSFSQRAWNSCIDIYIGSVARVMAEHFSMTLLSVSPFLFTRLDSGWKFLFPIQLELSQGWVECLFWGLVGRMKSILLQSSMLQKGFRFISNRTWWCFSHHLNHHWRAFQLVKQITIRQKRPRNTFLRYFHYLKSFFLLTVFYFSSGQLEPFMVSEQFSHLVFTFKHARFWNIFLRPKHKTKKKEIYKKTNVFFMNLISLSYLL